MKKPKIGDIVRVQCFIFGRFAYMKEFKLEGYNFCLGYYGDDGLKTPCNFTPLSELWEPSPDAEIKYKGNYGEYHTKHVQTFEIIAKA